MGKTFTIYLLDHNTGKSLFIADAKGDDGVRIFFKEAGWDTCERCEGMTSDIWITETDENKRLVAC